MGKEEKVEQIVAGKGMSWSEANFFDWNWGNQQLDLWSWQSIASLSFPEPLLIPSALNHFYIITTCLCLLIYPFDPFPQLTLLKSSTTNNKHPIFNFWKDGNSNEKKWQKRGKEAWLANHLHLLPDILRSWLKKRLNHERDVILNFAFNPSGVWRWSIITYDCRYQFLPLIRV